MFNSSFNTGRITSILVATGLAIAVSTCAASAQTPTEFTYQGVLNGPGGPVTTEVEIVFLLFDAPVNGNIQGNPISVTLTPEDGLFSVELDFGAAAFAENQPLWLQLDVSDTSNPINNDSFRQPLTSAPFAINTRGIGVDAASNVSIGTIGDPKTTSVIGQLAVDGFLSMGDSGLFFDDWDISTNQGNLFFNSDGGTRMIVDDTGFVGIGTLDPASTLSVVGDLPNDINQVGVHMGTSIFDFSGIRIVSPTDIPSFVDFRGANQGAIGFGGRIAYYPNTDILGVEQAKFRVLEDMDIFGKLGVGTETPLTQLHVEGTTGAFDSGLLIRGTGQDFGWFLRPSTNGLFMGRRNEAFNEGHHIFHDNGRIGFGTLDPRGALHVKSQQGDLGLVQPLPNDVTLLLESNSQCTLAMSPSGVNGGSHITFGNGATPAHGGIQYDGANGFLVFSNQGNGFITFDDQGNLGVNQFTPTRILDVKGSVGFRRPDESFGFRFDDSVDAIIMDSHVGIGQQSPSDIALTVRSSPGDSEIAWFKTASASVFEIRTNGQVLCNGSLLCSSDLRLKHDVREIDGALGKVLALRGVTFRWNDGQPGAENGEQVGLIAQEVEAVLPQLVDEGADGYKAVDYASLNAVLVEAVKTQQSQIETLSARVAVLEETGSNGPSPWMSATLLPVLAVGGVGGLVVARRRTAQT